MLQKAIPRAEVVAITSPVCMVGKSKAMVMDNHALWEICGGALAEIERLEARIEELSQENATGHATADNNQPTRENGN